MYQAPDPHGTPGGARGSALRGRGPLGSAAGAPPASEFGAAHCGPFDDDLDDWDDAGGEVYATVA